MREGFPEPALAAQRRPKIGMRLAQTGRYGNRLAQHRFCFTEPADVHQYGAQVALRERVVRGAGDAGPVFPLGVIEPVEFLQHAAQIVARVEVPGIDRERFQKARQRVGRSSEVAQHVAEIEPGERMAGKPAREPPQQRLGLAQPAFHCERIRDAELELRCSRIEAARLAERFARIRITGESEIRLRQVAEHAGMIAPRARGALEMRHGGCGVSELQQRRSEQVQRVRMIRRDGKHLLVGVPSGVEVPLGMLAQSGLDLSLQKVLARLHFCIMTGRPPAPSGCGAETEFCEKLVCSRQ